MQMVSPKQNTPNPQADRCGSDGIDDCYCAVPSAADARILGFDPVAPAAVYLVLLKVMTNDALSNIHSGTERDLKVTYVDPTGSDYVCRRNATFDAQECCGSTNGMVSLPELG